MKRWASAFIAAITCTTINALTLTAEAVGFTIAGGTTSKTLTVDEDATLSTKAPKASPVFTGDVTLSGKVTNATLPAFKAHPTTAQENFAVGSYVDILFGTEDFDRGANFASSVFTAPVTGLYQLQIYLYLTNLDSVSEYFVRFNTTGGMIGLAGLDFTKMSGDVPVWTISAFALVPMTAGDTAKVQIYQDTGTAQTDIDVDSHFSGFLVA